MHEHVERTQLGHLLEHAVARDVAAYERDLDAPGAELLGRLFRSRVVAQVADRDPFGAVRGEAMRDRTADAARPAGDEDVQRRGRSAGAVLGTCAQPGLVRGSRPPSSAFDEA